MFHRWGMHHRHPAFAGMHDCAPGAPERAPAGTGFGRPPFGPPWSGGLWRMGRGFPGGPGGPRAFGRGDLKYQLLTLLTERPKHGYEMIKELEEQAGGFYTPSAGAVYPSLQLMEDREWITSQTADGKKVYTLTAAGRQALEEHRRQAEESGGPRGGGRSWHGSHGPFGQQGRPELQALRHESLEVARLMWMAVMAAGGDPAKLTRLRAIVTGTRSQLEDLLGQRDTHAE
ncbi:MAG TPA: PadR family transcriptional regulator [Chloroflexia bacterium]|nr:PadR family transcriptional regulator [Chloroflexia bacterium]